MKIRYLKFKNWLLLTAMSLFGLTACHSQKELTDAGQDKEKEPSGLERGRVAPMYGVPIKPMQVTDTIDTLQSSDNQNNPGNTPKTVSQPQPREPQVTVYGVPTVDFSVKGRVVDANGKPVKGLQVILVDSRIDPDNLPDNDYWKRELVRMSDTTDTKGDFEVNGSDRPWENIRVLVRDIDGVKNGSFQDQLVDVQFDESDNSDRPMSGWKLGTKKAEITVKMKRKKK